MANLSAYEMVVGLEVHVELKTETKIFCNCPTAFGAPPNTQCCPVCMGFPGTLPVLNEQVVHYALKAGLALNCRIDGYSKQDRKNYFYPDLPKAYQISQYYQPLCREGYLDIETPEGQKRIGITRIQIEEDAGKLIHLGNEGTLIDYNRCGVPLIEIVSEPDIRSAGQARAYVQKLRSILLYTGISDCRMNEGSLRCDVNLSVRKKGEQALATRTEIKNLNSFQSIARAIEQEFRRQVEAVEAGDSIVQETRRFDQASGGTFSMRRKEDAKDYRYFPDPDLPPIHISESLLKSLADSIPSLPDERKALYMRRFGLKSYAAEQLTAQKELADTFEAVADKTAHADIAANLLLGEVLRRLPPEGASIPVSPSHFAALCDMLGEGRLNSSTGKDVLARLWEDDQDPHALVESLGLEQISDESYLRAIAAQAVAADAKLASAYRAGRTNVLQALVGQCMRLTAGKGNPVMLTRLLEEALRDPAQ